MRLLVMWADGGPEMKIIFDALERAGHEVVYWVGERTGEKNNPKSSVFHDHYDAWDGKPAQMFSKANFPPSLELIERMHHVESIAITMMNKRYDVAAPDERKQSYYSMLGYWNHVIETLKPDGVIFGMVPHSVYNYIVFELMKLRGLYTVMFDDTWIAARLLYYHDFWQGSKSLYGAVKKNKKTEITPDHLGEELRWYYFEQISDRPPKPPYLAAQRHIAEGAGLARHRFYIALKAIKQGTIFTIVWSYISKLFSPNLKKEYNKFVKPANLEKPFVYFPLGFQPERTTSPQGGVYHDQILVAKTLAAALPKGWELYVKEHPSQWWLRTKTRYSSARYPGYYERIASIPKTRVIPIETDSHMLINHARAVATVTGTAGWEAALRGKRSLVFGYPWYLPCPLITRVRSVKDCRAALQTANETQDINQETLRFLKSLEEASLPAYIGDIREFLGDLAGKEPYIQRDENMRIIADFLVQDIASDQ